MPLIPELEWCAPFVVMGSHKYATCSHCLITSAKEREKNQITTNFQFIIENVNFLRVVNVDAIAECIVLQMSEPMQ